MNKVAQMTPLSVVRVTPDMELGHWVTGSVGRVLDKILDRVLEQ